MKTADGETDGAKMAAHDFPDGHIFNMSRMHSAMMMHANFYLMHNTYEIVIVAGDDYVRQL